jgi:hypothetical protein
MDGTDASLDCAASSVHGVTEHSEARGFEGKMASGDAWAPPPSSSFENFEYQDHYHSEEDCCNQADPLIVDHNARKNHYEAHYELGNGRLGSI